MALWLSSLSCRARWVCFDAVMSRDMPQKPTGVPEASRRSATTVWAVTTEPSLRTTSYSRMGEGVPV